MFDLVIGLGQGGSRIAKEVARSFKIDGRYINTAYVDYNMFQVPRRKILILEGRGTGRNPDIGERLARKYSKRVTKFLKEAVYCNDRAVNSVAICVGGGGGSGTGLMFSVIDFFLDQNADVFLMYTLPKKVEGLPVKPQALKYLNLLISRYVGGTLTKKEQVSIMLIDNDFCASKYVNEMRRNKQDYWNPVNKNIVKSLKYFKDLTSLEDCPYVDISSGVGALDYFELMKILYYKEGFVDLRNIIFETPDIEQLKSSIRTSSQVFGSLDLRTAKAYIISIALPYKWKDLDSVNQFVDEVFSLLARATATPYVLRTSFFSKRLEKASVRLLLVGMVKSHGLEKILRQTVKDTEKYKSKEAIQQLDLSELDFDL